MSNCLLAFPNRVDAATLSAGSWSSSMPLPNLQTRDLGQFARTTDALAASTQFKIALPLARAIAVIALVNHNLTVNATYRMRGYSDSTFTTLVHDSGTLAAVPANTFTETPDEWGEGVLWDVHPIGNVAVGLMPNLVHCFATAQTAQFWLIEITDTANPNNYVQIGRCFLAEGFTAAQNMESGAQIGYEPANEITAAFSGAERFFRKPSARVMRFTFELLTEAEMTTLLGMQRRLLDTEEVFFMYDQADTSLKLHRSFLGRVRKLGVLDGWQYQSWKTAYEINELLP